MVLMLIDYLRESFGFAKYDPDENEVKRYIQFQRINPIKYKVKQNFSFVVFPFAKAYEGFLKKAFLGVGFISRLDYISDHFRLGKVLSPNLVEKLGERSVYKKIPHVKQLSIPQTIFYALLTCQIFGPILDAVSCRILYEYQIDTADIFYEGGPSVDPA